MKDDHRICISSPPDREKLVAEVFSATRNGRKSTKNARRWRWSFIHAPTASHGALITRARSRRWRKRNGGSWKDDCGPPHYYGSVTGAPKYAVTAFRNWPPSVVMYVWLPAPTPNVMPRPPAATNSATWLNT